MTDFESIALITAAAFGISRSVAHTFVLEDYMQLILADLNIET
jgi:NAD(P)-dependent dehydrogenase (short-subunit alcohol dehydrogenase family)